MIITEKLTGEYYNLSKAKRRTTASQLSADCKCVAKMTYKDSDVKDYINFASIGNYFKDSSLVSYYTIIL